MSVPDPTPVNQTPDTPLPAPTERIIIRLEQKGRSDARTLLEVAHTLGYRNLETFLVANSTIPSERVITHVAPNVLRDREAVALHSAFPPLKSLTSYWRLDVRSEPDAEALRSQLAAMPEIEVAYHETSVINAGPANVADPYESYQGALDPAPQGIDARAAWNRTNGLGQTVSVVDVESGWILDHEDVPGPELLVGDNLADYQDHGAAVLSLIGAPNNSVGIVGIAPSLARLDVASHYDAATDTDLHVANAIDAAAICLSPGDIVCIEVQRPQGTKVYPAEIDSADLHAIRLACAQGIIVVEAAGNWINNDLDLWVDPTGEHSFNPSSPLCNDSGAIMVGASNYAVANDPLAFAGHARYQRSNFGQRVNCYALGQLNYTAGYGPLGGQAGMTQCYTSKFGETSAATAIIAGAAAVVQSWSKGGWLGQPLSPLQMRSRLSAAATGTRQANKNGDPIGVMPNLAAIMTGPARVSQLIRCVMSRLVGRRGVSPYAFARFKRARSAIPAQ
jgi:serine protease